LGELREEISALLREGKISARRMHRDPAVRDGGFNRSAVFLIAAASLFPRRPHRRSQTRHELRARIRP